MGLRSARDPAIPDANGLSMVRDCSKRRVVADSVQPGNIRREPRRASDRAHRRISEPAWAKVRGNLEDSFAGIGEEEFLRARGERSRRRLRNEGSAAILLPGDSQREGTCYGKQRPDRLGSGGTF